MGNTIDFILRFLDFGLPKVQADAARVFSAVNKVVDNTQKKVTGLGRPVAITAETSGITKAGKELDNLADKVRKVRREGEGFAPGSGGGGAWFGGAFKDYFTADLAAGVVRRGADFIKDVAVDTFRKGVAVERQEVGLETFVGKNQAKNIYEQLQGQSVQTPYVTSQLLGGERGLIPYMSAHSANQDTMALANAVAAVGGSDYMLERMQMHMSQMGASGKMEGMQAREFQFAQIPIWQLLSDSTGKTQAQLHNMTITYDMVSQALRHAAEEGGLFAGAMQRLSQTVSGKASTIKDLWEIGQAKVLLAQADNIKKIEDLMIAGLNKFPEEMEQMEPVISRTINLFTDLIPSLENFGSGVGDALSPVFDLLTSPEFFSALKGLLDTGYELEHDVSPLLHGFGEAVKMNTGLLGVLAGAISVAAGKRSGNAFQDNFAFTSKTIEYVIGLWSRSQKDAASQLMAADPIYQQQHKSYTNLNAMALAMTNENTGRWMNGKDVENHPTQLNAEQAAGVAGKDESIHEGGPHIINITQEAMVKGTTYHVHSMEEAKRGQEQDTAEGLLKVLSSMGAAKGG